MDWEDGAGQMLKICHMVIAQGAQPAQAVPVAVYRPRKIRLDPATSELVNSFKFRLSRTCQIRRPRSVFVVGQK